MPNLIRKLLIFAAVDGLVLQPIPPRNHPPATQQAIKVDWKGNVSPLLKDRRAEDTSTSLEAWGVVGLLQVASTSFLISIASREQVAQIRGKPIYVISDVALIPLSSQAEAERAITSARESLKKQTNSNTAVDAEGSSDDDSDTATVTDDESLPENLPPSARISLERGEQERSRRTSVSQDVIARRGQYGRFAERWFSRKGWSAQGRQRQGLSGEEESNRKTKPKEGTPGSQAEGVIGPAVEQINTMGEDTPRGGAEPLSVSPEDLAEPLGELNNSSSVALLPKILRTAKIYFGSRSFYFSYDIDLSRRLGTQPLTPSSQPLFEQYDPLYFWNKHLLEPLIDAGQHSFVLPLIQGFVGQRAFTVDTSEDTITDTVVSAAKSLKAILDKHDEVAHKDPAGKDDKQREFLLTLVSRRSTKRAGLRYLRRGIDSEGNVANAVETEQLLSSPTWDTSKEKTYSFTQCRGSIPLFFSQSPYSLKPWPILHGSQELNEAAFKSHITDLINRYGRVQVASLVDKHGSEAKIGSTFEEHAKLLIEKGASDGGLRLGFEWFDFHNVCRGMRFENVSILMDTLEPFLDSTGWTIQNADGQISTQSGVLRTNCMDCLDRTNVVQSATARAALEGQLSSENVTIDLQNDPRTAWFNGLWADNGDAISKQYSGTAALKGDYTRTRKRQITGAISDFGLTLTRYYNNIVNDYFAQALIDYLLGRSSESIFAEFEADMKTQDYAIDIRKVRQAAIERCTEIVIEDKSEDLVAAWTLSSPAEGNTLRAMPFEECVVLLTEKALYTCRFEWATEKVKLFERIGVDDIVEIQSGVYITSTLASRNLNASKNVGLVVRYRVTAGKELVRRNTRSLDTQTNGDDQSSSDTSPNVSTTTRILAFKALPPTSTITTGPSNDAHQPPTEIETTKQVVDAIARVSNQKRRNAEGGSVRSAVEIYEKDIISAADAKKATGWVEQLGYNLKRLVWS